MNGILDYNFTYLAFDPVKGLFLYVYPSILVISSSNTKTVSFFSIKDLNKVNLQNFGNVSKIKDMYSGKLKFLKQSDDGMIKRR